MFFSIIVVTLNAGERLLNTVDSILSQTEGDYEIVVQDGLSVDGSVEKLPKDERIRIYSEKDKGIYDAMNHALTHVNGKYVHFLNCGDYYYNNWVLADLKQKMTETPDRGIYYGNAYFRLAGTVLTMPPEISQFTCFRNIPCHQACLFEKSLFDTEGFRTSYKIRADYEFFLRCYYKQHIFPYYTAVTIADYEGGGYSETKENQKRNRVEHQEILNLYMKKRTIFKYRSIMFLTLQPLRRYIAERSCFSGIYDKIKKAVYK